MQKEHLLRILRLPVVCQVSKLVLPPQFVRLSARLQVSPRHNHFRDLFLVPQIGHDHLGQHREVVNGPPDPVPTGVSVLATVLDVPVPWIPLQVTGYWFDTLSKEVTHEY